MFDLKADVPFKYLTFSLAISTISWRVRIIGNALLMRTASSARHLTHLNFLKRTSGGWIR